MSPFPAEWRGGGVVPECAEGSASSGAHFGSSLGSVWDLACTGGESLRTGSSHANLRQGFGPTLAPTPGHSGHPQARAGHAQPQSAVQEQLVSRVRRKGGGGFGQVLSTWG